MPLGSGTRAGGRGKKAALMTLSLARVHADARWPSCLMAPSGLPTNTCRGATPPWESERHTGSCAQCAHCP